MVKTITIKDEVYRELLKLKREGKSFSDIITELLRHKKVNLSFFYGVFKDEKTWKEIEEEIMKSRVEATLR